MKTGLIVAAAFTLILGAAAVWMGTPAGLAQGMSRTIDARDIPIPAAASRALRDSIAAMPMTPIADAVGRVRPAVLEAEVGEADGPQRQPRVGGDVEHLAVAGPEHPGVEFDGTARGGVLELEFMTPAIASEPYCAAAPSRST